MFSKESRCRYGAHPLAEVICQLRFPEILAVGAADPVEFQEAIRSEFPLFLRRQELPAPKITGIPGNMSVQNQKPVINYQFSTPDGAWRVNLTNQFISLTCTSYTCWEDFAAHLDKPLAAFIQVYKPAHFERVGLRYLNFISRSALGLEGVPFSRLIRPCYLGPLAEEDVSETAATRCTVDCELTIRGGCRAKIHAGPGLVKRGVREDKEVKFIFDQDLFMTGQLQLNLAAGVLQTLHHQADSIFRGAITQQLHEAMEPEII
ncbi:MAG: TIGR04255 family protein [Oscillospiraceae bacterium]|nr:TIGR04255 family protein [Oscillospiraceae bacterium]